MPRKPYDMTDFRTRKALETYEAGERRELPKAAFTPGPWTVYHRHITKRNYGKEQLTGGGTVDVDAAIGDADSGPTPGEAVANARLMGAAPELLDACKAAFDMVKNCPGNWDNQVRDMLNIAITRAEGK